MTQKRLERLGYALAVAVILYVVLGGAVQTYDAWVAVEMRSKEMAEPGRRLIPPSGGPVR